MIGVAVEKALRAVDLLGQDDAHERIGQGQRRERLALVGAPETARIEPVDPADQEGDIARSFPVQTCTPYLTSGPISTVHYTPRLH
jgi:hypothetical protein